MSFYKVCDCGKKFSYEKRGQAPRKCDVCTRSLIEVSAIEEDVIDEVNTVDDEEVIKGTSSDDISIDGFYYSLETPDGIHKIVLPSSRCVVGRNALGADVFASNLAVSKEHINVSYHGRMGLIIEDISKYGTFINDKQMVKGVTRLVRDGDIIKLYNFDLVVKFNEEE